MNFINLKNSISLRIIIIGFLSLILLIPVLMIQGIIDERFGRLEETQKEISSKWGDDQHIIGPVLVIPRIKKTTSPNGELQVFRTNIYVLPEQLNISGEAEPEIRYRGIYKAVLYTSHTTFTGNFNLENVKEFSPGWELRLNEAYLVVGISDLKGIKHAISVEWNKEKVSAIPGIKDKSLVPSGVSVHVPLKGPSNYAFQFELNLNGSRDLFFAPVGKVTNMELSSSWPHPVFTGSFLPEVREISEKGFSASWKVLDYNRNFPQEWAGNLYKLDESNFGVTFKSPVDVYQKSERTTKYAIMIIGLTFLTFFLIEILGKNLLHPVQYILIGFALLIFYILLLAFSEYIGFDWSYLIAAIAIIGLIASYSKSILNSKMQMLSILGILSFLYFYLYVILQLQDFALLMGSIGLFIILSIVMYLTRKVDWYNVISK